MNKPTSELIALADDYLRNGAAESGAHELIRQLADCLRTANQFGSERARVDAPFQGRVRPWMLACFGPVIPFDKTERNHRFLEEAIELVQSLGCTQNEAYQLVDYVYGRPEGEPNQEVGGVMVTLAALCLANDLDMAAAGETELARIWTKVEKIRAKQAAKPKHSPLPEVATPPAQPAATHDGAVRETLRILVEAINFRDRVACEPFDGARNAAAVDIFNEAMKKASVALLSPKIAAGETSPGDVLAMKEACKRAVTATLLTGEARLACAAIDRLDVKAEAKSQEPEAVAVQERKWKQPVKTVADLVNNLMTIDQTMDVHTAYFITHGDGRKEARTRSPSLSRERVANSRINNGDEAVPYSLVIWTSQDERPTTKPEAPASTSSLSRG